MNSISETDLAWIAGILEGEGYFFLGQKIASNGTPYPHFRVQLNMTDADVVRRVANIVGVGRLRGPLPVQQSHHKPAYSWMLHKRQEIYDLCKLLLPWMGERRGERIKSMMHAFEESTPPPPEHGTRPRYTDGCRCNACRAINNARQKAYRQANPEKFAGYRANKKLRIQAASLALR